MARLIYNILIKPHPLSLQKTNFKFQKFCLPTQKLVLTVNLFLVIETKKCYFLAIGFEITVIWGYLKFGWLMLYLTNTNVTYVPTFSVLSYQA